MGMEDERIRSMTPESSLLFDGGVYSGVEAHLERKEAEAQGLWEEANTGLHGSRRSRKGEKTPKASKNTR